MSWRGGRGRRLAGGEGEGPHARDGARREEGRRRSEARSEVEISDVEITEEAAMEVGEGQRPYLGMGPRGTEAITAKWR